MMDRYTMMDWLFMVDWFSIDLNILAANLLLLHDPPRQLQELCLDSLVVLEKCYCRFKLIFVYSEVQYLPIYGPDLLLE